MLNWYRSAKKNTQVRCPDCDETIPDWEIRQNLNEKEKEEYESIIELQMLAANPNLVRCTCGNAMEVVQGKVDYNQKDENGKPFTQ